MGSCSTKDKNGLEKEQQLDYPQNNMQRFTYLEKEGQQQKPPQSNSNSNASTQPSENGKQNPKNNANGEEKYSFQQLAQKYDERNKDKASPDKFMKLKILGIGGFGKVFLARYAQNGKVYAMKSIVKESIDDGQEKYQAQEKFILEQFQHPFCVNLEFAFQTSEELFLVLEFCQGGELLEFLTRNNYHNEQSAIFYVAQLILVFERLHKRGVIYRDLKPGNILLHKDGYLRLTDFGLCKLLKGDQKTYTQCGTRQYIPPEVFMDEGYDCTSDYFNIGLMTYEILTGQKAFYQFPEGQRMQKIIQEEEQLIFPESASLDVQDFIQRLLKPMPDERLGSGGIQELKDHPFLQTIDWGKLEAKEIDPPIILTFTSDIDVSYFNPKFTCQPIKEEKGKAKMDHYQRYTYVPEDVQDRKIKRVDTIKFIQESKKLKDDCTKPIEEVGMDVIKQEKQKKQQQQTTNDA